MAPGSIPRCSVPGRHQSAGDPPVLGTVRDPPVAGHSRRQRDGPVAVGGIAVDQRLLSGPRGRRVRASVHRLRVPGRAGGWGGAPAPAAV